MFTHTDDRPVIAPDSGCGRPDVPAMTAVRVRAADLAAVPDLRRFARDAARGWGVPDEVDEALALIVTELVTNVVRHSGSPTVVVLLAAVGATLAVEVRDTGRWRVRGAPRGPAEEAAACSGRGLRLVEAYASSCEVRRTARGTRVIVELPGVPVRADGGGSSSVGYLAAA